MLTRKLHLWFNDGSGTIPVSSAIAKMVHAIIAKLASNGDVDPSPAAAPASDPTLEHPRCVFQILKRHYARYTPQAVEEICGVPRESMKVNDPLTGTRADIRVRSWSACSRS